MQVRACGVCQTEVHAIDGTLARTDIPGMMGHEFSGEVVALGTDVTRTGGRDAGRLSVARGLWRGSRRFR